MGAYDEILAALPSGGPDTGTLQCPARLFLVPAGAGAAARVDRLTGERVARVWAGPDPEVLRIARVLADRLGAEVVVRDGLAGDAAVVREVLGEIADQHRGEAVLVVTGPEDLAPRSAEGVLAVEAGDDGWRRLPDGPGPGP